MEGGQDRRATEDVEELGGRSARSATAARTAAGSDTASRTSASTACSGSGAHRHARVVDEALDAHARHAKPDLGYVPGVAYAAAPDRRDLSFGDESAVFWVKHRWTQSLPPIPLMDTKGKPNAPDRR
jgi:hypothetical protein